MLDVLPHLAYSYLFFTKSQRWSPERQRSYQDERLRRLVRHAADRVPYYRKLFHEIGLDPCTFRGREDLAKIPLLDKEIVRTRSQELIADNAVKYGVVWESTSGSTGTPLRVIVDRSARAAKLTALIRSYQWAGYRLGMKTFSAQSYYLHHGFYQFYPLFRVLRYDSNQLKKETAVEVARLVQRWQPRFFMGFPLDLLLFNRFAAQAGIPLAPKSVLTYGETLSEHSRQALETGYGGPVFNFYAQHECASMIAECEAHRLHLVDDFACHEIVDEQGQEVSSGAGELIGTSLYNYAMPLLRYRTRDLVVREPKSEVCSCGRRYPVIQEIIGKQCDYLETPDGRLLGAVMSHSMDNAQGVVVSQCVQDARDHMYVNLVVDETYSPTSQQALERDLRKRVGPEMRIEFRQVQELEKRPSGKAPFLLSKIGHNYQ